MGVIQHLPRALAPRDVGDDIRSYTERFDTIPKCMTENICKLPFIIGITVGGIIFLSLFVCLLRCCLCGYACCACCCGGFGGRRKKRSKLDISHPSGPMPVRHSMAAPKYTYFDSKNDDALPAMPSLGGEMVKERPTHVEIEMSPVQGMGPFAPRPGLGRDLTGTTLVEGRASPGLQRPPSEASEYSNMGSSFRGPGQGQGQGRGPSPVGFLSAPQPGFANANRNTVQKAYDDGPVNPYQYQGPRIGEQHVQGDPMDRRRQQEWSVI